MAALPANADGGSPVSRQSDFMEGFGGLTILRQIGLMVGLAASVAIGVWVVLWAQEDDYMPLYTNLDQMDPTDVLNALDSSQINYKVDNNTGALLVVSSQIYDARLQLASAGISPDGSFGLELLNEEQPLGTSQFMESARYMRGLEGELARTISSIRSVRGARVHLAIPKSSAFIRDRRKPTASVFLDLYSGAGLKEDQVRAVANLVASSISELALESVTVVDQRGNLLSNFEDDEDMAVANKQLDYTQQIETRLVQRISSILEPVLGIEGFRAEVSANVDFTQIEQTDESYNPDLPAIRSEQTVEEARASGSIGGIPGALSNQPPADGAAPEQANANEGADSGGAGSSRTQSVRNYELDRTISHTLHQVGRLQRLSVAVLVDNLNQVDATTGDVQSIPIEQAELDRLSILIKDAVGFDAARGDSVNIINSAFMLKPEPETVVIEEIPIWMESWVWDIAKKVGGGLVLLFIVLGLFRMMRSLTETAQDIREIEAQRALGELSGDMGGELGEDSVTLSGGDSLLLGGPNENYEQQLDAVKGLVAEDPGRVAQVVKKWVAAGE